MQRAARELNELVAGVGSDAVAAARRLAAARRQRRRSARSAGSAAGRRRTSARSSIAWVVVAVGLGVFAPRVETALSGAGWQANGSESVAGARR